MRGKHHRWYYDRITKRIATITRITDSEQHQLHHILRHRDLEYTQLVRECMTHYLACPNHSPEIQSVIDAARELYP